jgi:hypothetical protein
LGFGLLGGIILVIKEEEAMKKILVCLIFFAVLMLAFHAVPVQTFAADQETNKQVLKDALVGAVTGAVAVEAAKDTPSTTAVQEKNADTAATNIESKHSKKDKSKEGHRPPGWDKGKKTGWLGADTPPGQHKGKK